MTSSSTSTSASLRTPDDQLHPGPQRLQVDVSSRTVIKVLFLFAVFVLASRAVVEMRSLIIQIAIALFLAVAADPLVRRLQARGFGRGRAVATIMAGVFVVLAIIVAVFVPPLVSQGNKLIENSPSIVQDVRHSKAVKKLDRRYDVVDKASNEASKLPGKVGSQIGSIVGAVASALLATLTIFFLVVFLLLGGNQLATGAVRLIPRLTERRWWSIVEGAYIGISAYVGGAIIIALCGGVSLAIMAFILGLPYVLPLGLWMMLLEIIPLVGASIGAIPAVIVAFVAGGVTQGIVMVIFIVVYQQIENILIQPRVQGRVSQLSPLVVFVSVLIGSQLLGVLGALFAVPVAGVVQIFVRQVIEERGTGDTELPEMDGTAVSYGDPEAAIEEIRDSADRPHADLEGESDSGDHTPS